MHLFDVWALAPDDVYAVGEDGTILHYDGANWIAETSGTTNDLLGVSAVRDPVAGVTAAWATGADVLLRTEHPLAVDPVALPDRYVVDEDSVLTVPSGSGVLANDTDPEGDALAATVVEPPRLGTLVLQPNGVVHLHARRRRRRHRRLLVRGERRRHRHRPRPGRRRDRSPERIADRQPRRAVLHMEWWRPDAVR